MLSCLQIVTEKAENCDADGRKREERRMNGSALISFGRGIGGVFFFREIDSSA